MKFEPAQRQAQEKLIEELRDLGQISPNSNDFGSSAFRISITDSPHELLSLNGLWDKSNSVREYRFLSLEIDGRHCIEHSSQEITNSPDQSKLTEANISSLTKDFALTSVRHEAYQILLMANISYPGSISTEQGVCFVDDTPAGEADPFFAENLFGAVYAAVHLGWPKFFNPTFQQAWNWMRSSDAIQIGVGVGPLGRSLAALSHLTTSHTRESSSLDLVWILLGLESLYSKGNLGLKEQLLVKTEIILGPRTENKKALGMVYDFRSRLLHGDIDIPTRFTEYDGADKFEEFHDDLAKSSEISLAVLIATLQWMIINNRYSLNFSYNITP